MTQKPTYEELEQKIKELERKIIECKQSNLELRASEEMYRFIAENSSDIILSTDNEGRYLYVSPSHKRLLGRGTEILDRSIFEHIHPEDLEYVRRTFEEALNSGEITRAEHRYYHPEKGYIWLESVGQRHFVDNRLIQTVITCRDITKRKQTEEKLQIANDIIIRSPAVAFVWKNAKGWPVKFVSENVDQIFGWTADDFMSGKILYSSVVHPDDFERVAEEVAWYSADLIAKKVEHDPYRIIRRDGETRWVKDMTHIQRSEDGEIIVFKGILLDITEKKQSEIALRDSEEKYKKLINTAPDAIALVDEDGEFLAVNPSMAERFGLTQKQLEGKSCYEVMPQDLADRRIKKGREAIEKGKVVYLEDERADMYLQNYCVPVSISGKKRTFQIISRDITEQKKMEERLKEMSLYDSLTKSYNRAFFEEEMRRLGNGRYCPIGIIICDIDGLKLVNDTIGHDKGDELLKQASDILRRCFRTSDIVARIGGDEFAVLLPQCNEEIVSICRNRIREEVEQYNEKEPELGLSISIGYSFKYNPPVDMNELFKQADDLMYKEKIQQSYSSRSETVQALIKTMEIRDYITNGHGERLQDYAQQLGETLGLSEERLNDLHLLGRFHDLGKVGVSDTILFKPGPLTEEELKEMKRHCEIGHRIALSISDLAHIADFILKHHEWWNGQGYPLGLKGKEIPLECRILSIVDAYDAMTSERPYKKAMSHQEAVEELRHCAGTQFDPNLVEKFIWILEESNQEDSLEISLNCMKD